MTSEPETAQAPRSAHRVPAGVGMSPDRMVLTLDHERWAHFFEAETQLIATALQELSPIIEHVGSTAVRGLLAKPIVDVAVVVGGVEDLEGAVAPLQTLGYLDRGQNGDDPLRRYLVLEVDQRRVAQLHVWTETAAAWREGVAFRDLLRTRDDLCEAYALEKRRVAAAVGWDKRGYSLAKGVFVGQILDRWIR
mgnify:CR=1 FL=1